MRPAAAVAVCCSGGAAWRAWCALLPALAVAALLAWLLQRMEQPAWPAAPLAGVPVAGLAWWRARPVPVALRWDGQAWWAGEAQGDIAVMIDLGRWLLLRHRAAAGGGARWIAVTAAEAGAAWHPLRAALYSRPTEPEPRAAPPAPGAD